MPRHPKTTPSSIGVYYTPKPVVQFILAQTLAPLLAARSHERPIRILEPACGEGAFLLGAYQLLLQWLGPATLTERQRLLLDSIYGVDIDARAVEVTRRSLLRQMVATTEITPDVRTLVEETQRALTRNIQCGNAVIEREFGWAEQFPRILAAGGFDLVIGNPPYLGAEQMSDRFPNWRQDCTARYRTASGNWDLFCVFVERSIELCKTGGLTSFVVPNKLASASYATAVRRLLAVEHHLLMIRDYTQIPIFPVAVYPIVYVTRKTPPPPQFTVRYERVERLESGTEVVTAEDLSDRLFRQPEQPWPIFTHAAVTDLILRLQQTFPALGTIAQITGAATVAEAYQMQTLIQECSQETNGLKLVNSGTIDRYRCLWGEKLCRYLGRTFRYPGVIEPQISQLPAKRLQQARQPKIIVAGLSRMLECMVDPEGTVLAGKSTSVITSSLNLLYLLAILNSQLLTAIYQSLFGGDRLQGGYLRMGPAQLRTLPIPVIAPDQPEVQRLVMLAQQACLWPQAGLLAQIDRLVYQLYGLTDREVQLITTARSSVVSS